MRGKDVAVHVLGFFHVAFNRCVGGGPVAGADYYPVAVVVECYAQDSVTKPAEVVYGVYHGLRTVYAARSIPDTVPASIFRKADVVNGSSSL